MISCRRSYRRGPEIPLSLVRERGISGGKCKPFVSLWKYVYIDYFTHFYSYNVYL